MPDISAYADTFREWDKLIGALNAYGSLVPGHEGLKGELLATLEQAKQLKIDQESLTGNRLAATDRLLNKVDEGRLKFSQLRSFIVSVLGPRSPLLAVFGIPAKPEKIVNSRLRKARAKAASQPTGTKPVPADPPTAAPPAPEAQPTEAAEPDKVKQ